MIKLQIITTYSIGDELPGYSQLPHGTTQYDALKGYHDLEELENLIEIEISNLNSSLNKYDHDFEPEHKTMCSDMRLIKRYLTDSLDSIQKLIKYKN